ncbi:hypothetical protein OAV88_03210 [bacterium]|nr:hypothetical protein [bacterium]
MMIFSCLIVMMMMMMMMLLCDSSPLRFEVQGGYHKVKKKKKTYSI